MKKIKIPGIGMRIIKSAVAVFVCYIINIMRGGQGMVFYSLLAALWCIQMYRSNTIKNALQRTVGTVVGAVFGLIYLLIYSGFSAWTEAVVMSLMIILVLYTTVLLDKKQASYFSCVVFLSIVVNHIGDVNPYLFVWNRFLDTMIGIGVGVAVNDIKICLHPDRETLFISGLDDTLLNKKDMLSAFSKVELNRMLDDGMQFTISTMRTPAALLEPMHDIRLKLPVIAMDGAVLYDIKKHSYLRVYVISAQSSKRIMEMIKKAGINWYANVIIEDMLLIFHEDSEDEVNKKLVENLRTSPFRNYLKRPMPEDTEVAYFMLLDKAEKIDEFYNQLVNEGLAEEFKIITYASHDFAGYAYIKIYNKNATKANMIMYLQQLTGLERVVTFGTIPGKYDVLIKENDANEVVKGVRKRYEPIIKRKK